MADKLRLPTEEDIRQLPRWARVAFAARCARRVLPLLKNSSPELASDAVAALVAAVEEAERSASQAAYEENPALAAHQRAKEVFGRIRTGIATDVARAACNALAGVVPGHDYESSLSTLHAVAYALSQKDAPSADVVPPPPAAIDAVVAAIGVDVSSLSTRSGAEGWTDDTPVPPEVFGPLWPNGPPPGWPADVTTAGVGNVTGSGAGVIELTGSGTGTVSPPPAVKLVVDALIRPGVSPEVVERGLVDLYRVMNEYHMARGAGVLGLEDFRRFVRANVPVEV